MATTTGHLRGTSAWRRVRAKVLSRDEFTCYYCGNEATQVDHVVPIKDEPALAFDESNLVSACARCNRAKGTRSQALFLAGDRHPPIWSGPLSPQGTVGTVQPGPMQGQPKPAQT
jgi:5-methylcytosine-specific restriction endonuclease McrA